MVATFLAHTALTGYLLATFLLIFFSDLENSLLLLYTLWHCLYWKSDWINGKQWFKSHSFVNAIDELLIFFDLDHELAYPSLIEERLTFIARFSHISSYLAYLLLSFQYVPLKYVDLVPAMHVDVLHHICSLFLLALFAICQNTFSCLLETVFAFSNPCLCQDPLLFVYCTLI